MSFTAKIAKITADKEEAKVLKRQKKQKDEADKEKRKATAVDKEEARKEEVCPLVTAHVAKYTTMAKEVTRDALMKEISKNTKKSFLEDVLVIHYSMTRKEARATKKPDLLELFVGKVTPSVST